MEIRLCRPDELPIVLAMSGDFLAENCCNGLVPDTLEELSQYDIYLASQDDQVVGYAYGQTETATRNRGPVKAGERSFSIEIIYIKPAFRNMGVGRLLFQALESQARESDCTSLQLAAVSKSWQKLLHFYIDELGMEFWSAILLKKL